MPSRPSPPSLLQPVFAALPAFAALCLAAVLSMQLGAQPTGGAVPANQAPISPPAPAAAPGEAGARPIPVAAQDGYRIRSLLPDGGPLDHGAWKWDESSAPAQGKMVIFVDIGTQVLSVFRDGHEIGYSTIIYGADQKPTPLGRYPITQKKRDHWSTIYEDAPMPFMLRMTNDGISIHGAEDIAPDYATNGCVGLPIAFAAKLFDAVALGDIIIVQRNSGLQIGDAIPLV